MQNDKYQKTNGNSKAQEIGALWRRTDKNGDEYFSGKLNLGRESFHIKVFTNKNKKPEEKTPDLKIFRGFEG